jgi:hypothetical protein
VLIIRSPRGDFKRSFGFPRGRWLELKLGSGI